MAAESWSRSQPGARGADRWPGGRRRVGEDGASGVAALVGRPSYFRRRRGTLNGGDFSVRGRPSLPAGKGRPDGLGLGPESPAGASKEREERPFGVRGG